jgi:hypothetical protein
MKGIRRIENKSVFVSQKDWPVIFNTGQIQGAPFIFSLERQHYRTEKLYPLRNSLTNALLSENLKGTERNNMSKPF